MGKTVDEGDGRGTTFRKDFGFGLRSRVAAHPRAGEGACPHTVEDLCAKSGVTGPIMMQLPPVRWVRSEPPVTT
jgi:hypothetical protein